MNTLNKDCPHCGKTIKIPINKSRPPKSVKCRYCKSEITFTGRDLKDIHSSKKSFDKEMKKLSKIKISL